MDLFTNLKNGAKPKGIRAATGGIFVTILSKERGRGDKQTSQNSDSTDYKANCRLLFFEFFVGFY